MAGASDGRFVCSKAAQREPVVATRIKPGPKSDALWDILRGKLWNGEHLFLEAYKHKENNYSHDLYHNNHVIQKKKNKKKNKIQKQKQTNTKQNKNKNKTKKKLV